ncbi:GEVED domain-containing protein [Tenacibaculum sp. 190524A02b]|uniref:GEVED domain-containing protein n=1 Tax=Tenacibaculum vairaonense TaxID=3137860 RepID=UPI0031FB5877
MKILSKFLLLLSLGITSISTQSQESNDIPLRCETPSRENYFSENSNAREEAYSLEKFTQKFIAKRKELAKRGIQNRASKYIVPVVFHVFGTDFVGKKVDDALVKDALKKTNEDFNGLNNDFNDVSDRFKPLRSTLDIEFRLATIDPNGNPTTGINYYTNRAGFGADNIYDEEIAEFAWDNYKYFNVYILLDLKKDGKLNRSGVAWYPNKNQSDRNVARAVFNGRYLGTNGDENFRRILTHEFGHYLNLAHTFEGGCSGTGDNVDDTPATTVSLECLVTQEKCAGAGIPNSENFMDYTDCYRMFTKGQVQRMQAALEFSSRKPLWQSSNHAQVFSTTNEAKIYYDFTTFSESFENDGTIGGGRDVKVRLENGPKFSRVGTLSSSSFTTENLPAGLGVQVISSSDTEAVIRLTGKATQHAKENNIRNFKLTFTNAAFSNYSAANIKGYSRPDLRVEFNDAYESTYLTFDELRQVSVDGNNFTSIGINEGQQRPRYELSIDNGNLMFGYDAGTKHVAVNNNKQVLFIEEGTTIGANLNWDHNDRDRVLLDNSYQAWKGKRGFVGLRIERESFPGKYYYGWARIEVSADGKIVRFIDFYSHKNPEVTVVAGQTDKPFIAISKPTFFENEVNNGTFSEEIDIILEGSATFTNQNLASGIHYSVSNLPEGLSASIQKVNNKLAKLKLQGTANTHVKGDGVLTKLQFTESAFTTSPTNTMNFDVQVRFFDPYDVTYIDTANLLPWINKNKTNRWIYVDTDFDFGDNSRYSVTYYEDSADNGKYVVLNGRGKGFTMNAENLHPESLNVGAQVGSSSNFVSTGYGVNNAPKLSGTNVPHNGKVTYTGFRFRDRAGRLHYGWIKFESRSNGLEAKLLAMAFNRKPNESITVGQIPNDYCHAAANINEKYDNSSNSIGEFKIEQFVQKSDFPENYTNFTSKLIKVRPGKNNFTMKNGGRRVSDTDIFGMWIDLNNDKDFEDSGEQIYMSSPFPGGSTHSGEVNLPNVDGTYTLRIIVKSEKESDDPKPSPCDFFLHGEVEDYTINISNSNPIYPVPDFEMPSTISAKELVEVTDKSTRNPDTWNWEFEGGVPATFNGKTPPSIYYENEGTYKVTLTVKKGDITQKIEKTLKVNPHPTNYCEVTRRGDYKNRSDVTKVVFGDINNTTERGGTGYADFTNLSTSLVEGQTYSIELNTYQQVTNSNNDRGTNLIVWIDWNRNNEFSENEIAYERRSLASDTPEMVLTSNITVPKIYSNGASRMRIVRYYSYGLDDRPRCGAITEGDTEDYTVNLTGTIVKAPVASFEANPTTIKEGNTINFSDTSTNEPTEWAWTFEGGTPATSTAQNPVIVYNTAGVYKVTLTAKNLGGENTIVKEDYITVETSGGGDVVYCESSGSRVQYEWIAKVQVGDFTNTSDAQKYSNFTTKTIPLTKGSATNITLTPGHSGSAYEEYFKVWIDYNQDGVFAANEVVFDAGKASKVAVSGTINVPNTATSGTTRMRVSMKYKQAPNACGSIGDGEVEDYTVNISGGTTNPPNNGNVVYVDMPDVTVNSSNTWSPFQIEKGDERYFGPWYSSATINLVNYGKDVVCENTTNNASILSEGVTVGNTSNFNSDPSRFVISSASYTNWHGKSGYIGFSFNINGDKHYGWFYATVSNDGKTITFKDYAYHSEAGKSLVTKRPDGSSAKSSKALSVNKEELLKGIQMFPNPVSTELVVHFNREMNIDKANFNIQILDVTGKLILEETKMDRNELRFNVENFKNGTYILQINNGGIQENKLFIKQ